MNMLSYSGKIIPHHNVVVYYNNASVMVLNTRIHVYMYVCVCVRVCVCVHACMYVGVCVYIHIYVVCVLYACIHINIHKD